MEPRHSQVLITLVAEYIDTAHPVGSERVAQRLNLALSPASIRWVLRDLETSGLIEQPHTSAGRIPTDRGYRYFVDHVPVRALSPAAAVRLRRRYQQLQSQYRNPSRTTALLLSQVLHAFAVSYSVRHREVREAGLNELLSQPEAAQLEAVQEIVDMAQQFEANLNRLLEAAAGKTQVFIGKENPIYEAQYTSVMVRPMSIPGEGRSLLVLFGPKRMPYERNLSLLDAIPNLFMTNHVL